jgi:pilus assembly protein CpaB
VLETQKSPKQQNSKGRSKLAPSQLLSTRRGTTVVALVSAILAAGVLMVFLNQYRDSVDGDSKPQVILVAKSLIERGTPGNIIASTDLFRREAIRKSEVKDGAITDPGALRARVANTAIYPGQQLTAANFGPAAGATTNLSKFDRAISVPIEAGQGLVAHLRAGDRVDLLAALEVTTGSTAKPIVRKLVENALVLAVPLPDSGGGVGGSSQGGKQVLVRVSDAQADAVAFAAEHGSVWLTLRPPAGARDSRITAATAESMAFGLKPLRLKPRAR